MGKIVLIGNNIKDKSSILNLLRSFIFDNKHIEMYDPTKVYNTLDQTYYINNDGDVIILTANVDNITGPLDLRFWTSTTLPDTISNAINNIIHIGSTEPSNNLVKIWFAPISYSSHKLPESIEPAIPDVTKMNMVFSDGAIPLVDNAETDVSSGFYGIIMDAESSSTDDAYESTNKSFEDAPVSVIDEQEDIHVGDDEPEENSEASFWVDSDITDDV